MEAKLAADAAVHIEQVRFEHALLARLLTTHYNAHRRAGYYKALRRVRAAPRARNRGRGDASPPC